MEIQLEFQLKSNRELAIDNRVTLVCRGLQQNSRVSASQSAARTIPLVVLNTSVGQVYRAEHNNAYIEGTVCVCVWPGLFVNSVFVNVVGVFRSICQSSISVQLQHKAQSFPFYFYYYYYNFFLFVADCHFRYAGRTNRSSDSLE